MLLRIIDFCGAVLLFAALWTGVMPKNTPLSFLLYMWIGSFLTRFILGFIAWLKSS